MHEDLGCVQTVVCMCHSVTCTYQNPCLSIQGARRLVRKEPMQSNPNPNLVYDLKMSFHHDTVRSQVEVKSTFSLLAARGPFGVMQFQNWGMPSIQRVTD